MTRFDNEVATVLGGTVLTLDPQKDYRLEFFGAGNTLMGLVYDLNDLTVPLTSVFTQDSAYSSGSCGLIINGLNPNPTTTLNATFDNLTIVPEPTVGGLAILGLSLACLRRRLTRTQTDKLK